MSEDPVLFDTSHGEFRRSEVIDGLNELYRDFLKLYQVEHPNTTAFPDYELMLAHIEVNGIPPRA